MGLTTDRFEVNQEMRFNRWNPESPTKEGVINLKISEMAIVEEIDEQQVLTPTQKFIDYYERISKRFNL